MAERMDGYEFYDKYDDIFARVDADGLLKKAYPEEWRTIIDDEEYTDTSGRAVALRSRYPDEWKLAYKVALEQPDCPEQQKAWVAALQALRDKQRDERRKSQ